MIVLLDILIFCNLTPSKTSGKAIQNDVGVLDLCSVSLPVLEQEELSVSVI